MACTTCEQSDSESEFARDSRAALNTARPSSALNNRSAGSFARPSTFLDAGDEVELGSWFCAIAAVARIATNIDRCRKKMPSRRTFIVPPLCLAPEGGAGYLGVTTNSTKGAGCDFIASNWPARNDKTLGALAAQKVARTVCRSLFQHEDPLPQEPLLARPRIGPCFLEPPHQLFPLLNFRILPVRLSFFSQRKAIVGFEHHEHARSPWIDLEIRNAFIRLCFS